MSISRLLRNLRLKRDLDRALRARREIRERKRDAALRGVSNEWRRRGEACRKLFGERHG